MSRHSAFDRLADLAGKIDALNKSADSLARKLVRAKTPREAAAISQRGRNAENRLRELERSYRQQERLLLRPSARQRRAETERARLREREKEERSILDQLRVGQRFMVQATYRRKNHNLFVDVIITYIGLPLDERSDKAKITQAVIDLANGRKPAGFSAEAVRYGKKHDDLAVRRTSELGNIKDALASNKTHWTVGEL